MTDRRGAPGRRRSPAALPAFSNYRMSERAAHLDFGIRSQDTALPNPAPHRHEYLQIHVQLQGTTRHFLDGASRPVVPGTPEDLTRLMRDDIEKWSRVVDRIGLKME